MHDGQGTIGTRVKYRKWQRRDRNHFKGVTPVSAKEKVLAALCIAAFTEGIRLVLYDLLPVIVRLLLGL